MAEPIYKKGLEMSGNSKLIGRQAEISQIGNFLLMSPILIVTGVKGVGKTYLIRQWLMQNGKKFKWHSLGQHLNLREVLGVEDKNLELALEDASKEWKNQDVIVWDNFQFLSSSNRSMLLSFILNSSQVTSHIFIGDENFLPLLPAEVPVIKLNPLNDADLESYLTFLGIEKDVHSLDDVKRKTSSLPLFINLLLQNRDVAQVFEQFKLSILGKDAQRIIKFMALLGRPILQTELAQALDLNLDLVTEVILALKNQYMVDDLPGDEGRLSLPSFVAQMCLSALKTRERQECGRLVLEYLIKTNSSDKALLLVHALKCQEYEMADNLLKTFKIDEWQQYSLQSLEEIRELLERSTSLDFTKNLNLSRSLLQIYFITGQREAGVTLGQKLLTFIGAQSNLGPVEQEIVVDIIRQQNRRSEFAQAHESASKILGRMRDPYQSHLYVEMAVSLMSIEPKRSVELLGRVINRDIAGTSFMMLDKLAKAHAHFQLARCMDNEKNFVQAQDNYEKALQQYDKLGQPYFAQVTRLNLLWIKVNQKKWTGFQSEFKTCYETCERYGYNYVLAGLDLLKSIELSDHIQFKEALKRAELSLERLPQKASRQALLDVHCQRMRVLNLMGKRKLASEVLGDILEISRLDSSQELIKKSRIAEIEMNSFVMSSNDILEQMEAFGLDINDEISIQELFAQRGHEQSLEALQMLRSYPLGQLRLLEYDIANAKSKEGAASLDLVLSSAENFLSKYPEAESELIRFNLIKIKQISRLETRGEKLHDLNILLDRASIDLEELKVYRQIFENLESYKSIEMDMPKGLKELLIATTLLDHKSKERQLSIIEQSGRREASQLDFSMSNRDVVVLEKTGEVYFKGALLKEFQRRQTLRKLLSLLVEVYPSFVSKQDLAMGLWAESYSPLTHDTRIYTSIKRVRELFGESDLIQSWSGGYRWNPKFSFALVRDEGISASGFMRVEALLVSAFQEFKSRGKSEVSRSDLVELVDSSEATVKRALSNLVDRRFLERNGKGRSVTYRLAL